jgi:hypothetical protein
MTHKYGGCASCLGLIAGVIANIVFYGCFIVGAALLIALSFHANLTFLCGG